MYKAVSLVLLLIFSVYGRAQKIDSSLNAIRQAEAELAFVQKGLSSRIESERIEANRKFIAAWDKIVADPNCLEHPFTMINEASILTSRDKKVRLITWNLLKDDGSHVYFGYILVNNSRKIKKGFLKYETLTQYESFKLRDQSFAIKNPETHVSSSDKWFGMLYYEMIECDGYYTLLGYDPNDKLTRRKFIDVLYFKSDGTPVFGKDVFRFPKKNPKRLMFEYSSEVTMSLKWNDKSDNIIFSHLAPKDLGDVLKDQPQYYGPDGSYDALQMKKDKWMVVEDIDARNDRNKRDESWNNPEKPRKKKEKKLMPADKNTSKQK